MPRLTLITPEWAVEEAYGGEISARLLRDGLVDRGWEVQVLTEATDNEEANVVRTSLNPWTVYKRASSFEADLLHAYNNEAIQATLLAARAQRIPCVATANSYWATCLWADMTYPSGELCQGCSMGGIARNYENRDPATVGRKVPTPLGRAEVARRTALLKAFDRIVALSAASGTQLAKGGVPISSIDVVSNMVDPRDLEAELPSLPQDPEILFVGQLSHVKGVRTLIDAMPRILEEIPAARLRIAGTGHLREELEQRVDELGIREAASFLGHVQPSRLRTIYEQARALAVPSVWVEPFGRVLLEAWGRGATVVASDRGGPGEVVEHEQTGLLTTPGDSESLADALVRVLQDEELALRLRSQGKQALARFRPEVILEDYLRIYEDLAFEGGD